MSNLKTFARSLVFVTLSKILTDKIILAETLLR
jgi:hypothetical protein